MKHRYERQVKARQNTRHLTLTARRMLKESQKLQQQQQVQQHERVAWAGHPVGGRGQQRPRLGGPGRLAGWPLTLLQTAISRQCYYSRRYQFTNVVTHNNESTFFVYVSALARHSHLQHLTNYFPELGLDT